MLYWFTCKAVESHYLGGYKLGKLMAFSEVIDHAGGSSVAAANEKTLSLLYEMRGDSAATYIWLGALYRTQQLDAKKISWKKTIKP